jgi:hypothetical protein
MSLRVLLFDMAQPHGIARLTIACALVAACTLAPAQTPAGTVPGGPPVSPSATSPQETVAVPTSRPSPTAAPPAVPFEVRWRIVDGGGAPSDAGSLRQSFMDGFPEAVRFGAGSVAVYEMSGWEEGNPNRGPMIWATSDLVSWRLAVPLEPLGHNVQARHVVAGGPGVVVLGGEGTDEIQPILWLSADAASWTRVTHVPDISFIWGAPGVLVGFGRETWTSTDGRSWTPAGPSPLSTAPSPRVWRALIVDDGDGAVVFVRTSFHAVTTVHRLDSAGTWQHLSDLPGMVERAVRGPHGFVALGWTLDDIGEPMAWVSPDGAAWTEVTEPPTDVRTLAATSFGYVATGARSYFQGCAGGDESAQVAQTWTSADGIGWRHLPEDPNLDHAALSILLPDGEGLLAIGNLWTPGPSSGDGEETAREATWRSEVTMEQPEPTVLPTGGGCGSG